MPFFPDKEEWRSWSSFERSAYLAQAVSPIALLFTVLFSSISTYISYLTFLEAQRGRAIQQEQLVSQFGAELAITNVEIKQNVYADGSEDGSLFVTVENLGETRAEEMCFELGNYLNSNQAGRRIKSCLIDLEDDDRGPTTLTASQILGIDRLFPSVRGGGEETFELSFSGSFDPEPTFILSLLYEDISGQKHEIYHDITNDRPIKVPFHRLLNR